MSTAEDRIHGAVWLVLAGLTGALLLGREPSAEPPRESGAQAPSELSRADLDGAIAELSAWFERAPAARSALDGNLRLLALGRAALEPRGGAGSAAPILANLERLAAVPVGAQPVALAAAGDLSGDAGAFATLVTLLEAGTPLSYELRLSSGPASLGQLLERAVPALAARDEGLDPWALDIDSFAVLAGKSERREDLARLAHAGLVRLDQQQRRQAGPRAPEGAPAGVEPGPLTAGDLQLAASVFRAVAVLGEPGLERSALRQLNALSRREPLQRDAERSRLGRAVSDAERLSVHLAAAERLGRLEQALYGAHVAFRRGDRPEPAPRTASDMRRAASELLEHLDALRAAGLLAPSAPGNPPAPELARALAHALRGLRVTRVAT